MSYILFYSDYCKYSQKFINILEKSGDAVHFSKICVDKDPRTNQRHEILDTFRITEVPSIIIEEQKKLAGYSAFTWLKKRVESSQDQVNSIPTRQNKQGVVQQPNQHAEQTTIQPYSMGGNSNFTDNCVQINRASDGEKIITPDDKGDLMGENDRQKMNNFKLQNDNLTSTAMNTPPPSSVVDPVGGISISKDKLKNKQFDNHYNQLMSQRDEMVPKPIQRV